MVKVVTKSSGKGQARIDKGLPLRRKALKVKPLPRAYIKVGCYNPPTTTTNKFNFTQLMARQWSGEAGRWILGEVCRVTMVHLRVNVGNIRVAVGQPRVTIGHLRVTL